MTELTEAIKDVPEFAKGWAAGLAFATLTDTFVFGYAVTGVATAVATRSPSKGVAVFLGLQAVSRLSNLHNEALVFAHREAAALNGRPQES